MNRYVKSLSYTVIFFVISGTFYGCGDTKKASKEEKKIESKPVVSNAVVTKETENKLNFKDKVLPGTLEGMNDENYWIGRLKDAKNIIMSKEQIEKFNLEITQKVPVVYDLHNYKESLTKNELAGYINFYNTPSKTMYGSNGNVLSESFYSTVKANCNISAIKENNPVSYALVVKKTNLRTFPTDEGVYDSDSLREIDRFQESSAEAGEPVVILHRSVDQKWFFVQMYNYRAWLKAEDVAVAKDKNEVTDFMDKKDFIIVTGNHVKTQFNPYNKGISQVELGMGTKLPLVVDSPEVINNQNTAGHYVVKLPWRNDKGDLEFKNSLISIKEDINIGYLPYTREDIIRQAFKLLGDRYDWGNKYLGRDCSGFVISVYNSFGIKLPRNTDEQEKGAGSIYKFSSGYSLEKRRGILDNAKAGAVIFMKGHEMMYLGKVDGVHYMIHDFIGYGEKNSSGYSFVPVYEVAVTSTELPLSSGQPFIKNFTSVLQLE